MDVDIVVDEIINTIHANTVPQIRIGKDLLAIGYRQ